MSKFSCIAEPIIGFPRIVSVNRLVYPRSLLLFPPWKCLNYFVKFTSQWNTFTCAAKNGGCINNNRVFIRKPVVESSSNSEEKPVYFSPVKLIKTWVFFLCSLFQANISNMKKSGRTSRKQKHEITCLSRPLTYSLNKLNWLLLKSSCLNFLCSGMCNPVRPSTLLVPAAFSSCFLRDF